MTTSSYSVGDRVAVARLNYITGVLSNNLGTVVALSITDSMVEIRLLNAIAPTDTTWYFTSSKLLIKIS